MKFKILLTDKGEMENGRGFMKRVKLRDNVS